MIFSIIVVPGNFMYGIILYCYTYNIEALFEYHS